MKKITVAIIGCGEFAEFQHFPNCMANSKVEIGAICDISLERMAYISERFGLKQIFQTIDYIEIFKRPEIDLVIAATNHDAHLQLIENAARYGKHILIEKPMSMNHEESKQIVRLVKASGIKLCVDYNRPLSPAMQDLKMELEEQRRNPRTSPWRSVRCSTFTRMYEENATNLVIAINDEIDSYRAVHLDPTKGGGLIIGESCHFLDLSCWLIGRRPVRIFATGSTRLNHSILLDFEDGSIANIFFSACGTFDYPKEHYELTANGNLFLNKFFVETAIYGRGDVIKRHYPLQFDDLQEQDFESGFQGYLAKRESAQMIAQESGQVPLLMPDKGHRQLLNAYVQAILDDTPSPVDEMRGARATYLSNLAIESIRTGRALPIRQEELEVFIK